MVTADFYPKSIGHLITVYAFSLIYSYIPEELPKKNALAHNINGGQPLTSIMFIVLRLTECGNLIYML